MQLSPMLQLKISGTKKRLSESTISPSVLWTLALCCLLTVLVYAGKIMTAGGRWGYIPVDVPVVSLPPDDPGAHNFRESPDSVIGPATMVIALTPGELIYGDLAAFTSLRPDVRNKFIVPHSDGSPQVSKMLEQSKIWSKDRKSRLGIRSDGIAIVVPDPKVPVAVVAGTVEKIRASGHFAFVTLAGGLQ